ncbi:hypothetical protein IG193_02030 [Infirmifilum lucidum]|uniref:L-fucose isomerase n=1 Tax=Infirmifilum lucidum TaxID=2776706 RepID=A0A7L9FK03_9CREN|nr:hypothetical protein [Infirmifilum lucidum]QOJ79264.1 hypothetical protein IG193_02030 [Infirmifilum lucidum]
MGRVYLIPVASPLHDPQAVNEVLNQYVGALGKHVDKVSKIVTSEGELSNVGVTGEDLALVAVLTGGSENLIVRVSDLAGYTVLLPHKTMNSLPASLEAYATLTASGKRSSLIVEWPPSGKVLDFINAWRAASRLSSLKLGLIGEPSPWLTYSSGTEVESRLKELFSNMEFVRVDLEKLYEEAGRVPDSEVPSLVENVFRGATRSSVAREELVKPLKIYLALKSIISSYGLDAITIRCFDVIKELKTTACLPLALLNSEGFTAGCEGDLPAVVTMYLASKLSNAPVFMGNLAWAEGNEVLMAHCTIALKLTSAYELKTHFESGLGVGIAGLIPEGSRVTMARLDPITKTLRFAVGTVTSGVPSSTQHCRTQVRIRLDADSKNLTEHPIGNHYVLAFKDISDRLRYVAEILGLAAD